MEEGIDATCVLLPKRRGITTRRAPSSRNGGGYQQDARPPPEMEEGIEAMRALTSDPLLSVGGSAGAAETAATVESERAPLRLVSGRAWSPGVYNTLRLLGKPLDVAWRRAFIRSSHF
jgi:hypothetical protein